MIIPLLLGTSPLLVAAEPRCIPLGATRRRVLLPDAAGGADERAARCSTAVVATKILHVYGFDWIRILYLTAKSSGGCDSRDLALHSHCWPSHPCNAPSFTWVLASEKVYSPSCRFCPSLGTRLHGDVLLMLDKEWFREASRHTYVL